MEKKNVIFLSVIAVATLLTAVIGTTFAYFTASITTSNADNSKTEVKTKVIASAVMDMGSKVTATDALPGFKTVKPVTVTGSGHAGDEPANATITVTPALGDFATDVTWKLYKSATAITCTSSPVTTGTQYYDNATCTIPENAEVVIDAGGAAAKSLNVSVAYNTKDSYYLVVEYANNGNQTGTQAGKSFSIDMSFAPKAN